MTNEEIDEICVKVYRARLEADGHDPDAQVRKHGVQSQYRWSRFYRPVVLETLIAVGLHEKVHWRHK